MKLFLDITLLLSVLATGVSSNVVSNGDGRESQKSLRAGSRRMDESCESVKDVICSLSNTKTFCEMVTKATKTYPEFGTGLEGDRPYTVFVPTDEAFSNVEEQLFALTPDEMYRTLLFHFNEDVVMTYNDLQCQDKLISLTGDTSRVKCRRVEAGVYTKFQRGKGNKELDDYPLIDIKSKEACSGIIHRLDHVLLPILFKPFKELVEVAEEPEVSAEEEEEVSEEEEEEEVSEEEEVEEEVEEESEEEEEIEEEEEEVVDVVDIVEEINEEVEVIVEQEEENTSFIDEEPEEETGGISNIDFDRDNKLPIGSDKYIPGTQIRDTEPEAGSAVTIPSVEASGETAEVVPEEPRIGALGINLIIFSTLLLCFVFVCMRR